MYNAMELNDLMLYFWRTARNHKSVTKNNVITSSNVTKGDNLWSYMLGKWVLLIEHCDVTSPPRLRSVFSGGCPDDGEQPGPASLYFSG